MTSNSLEILLYGFNSPNPSAAVEVAHNYLNNNKALFKFGKGKPANTAAFQYDEKPVLLTFKDVQRARQFMELKLPNRGFAEMRAEWKCVVDGDELKTLPAQLYEYQVRVSPVSVKNSKGEMETFHIKQRNVLQRVFNALGNLPALSSLRWATNFESLWSLEQINGETGADPVGLVFDTNSFYFESRDGAPMEMPNVRLQCTRILNLRNLTSDLRAGNDSGNLECIIAGLDALLTNAITSSKNHSILDPSNVSSYFLHHVGPNKFFHNSSDFDVSSTLKGHRGFFTSVRPGQKNMILNVNHVTGCFYRPLLVSEFMQEMLKAGAGIEDVKNSVLKLRVRLTYDRPACDEKTPNSEDHRRKCILDVGASLEQQMYSTRSEPTLRRRVLDYFKDIFTTHKSLFDKTVYCANVGSKLRRSIPKGDEKGSNKGKWKAEKLDSNAAEFKDDESRIALGDGYENFEKAVWIPSNLLEIYAMVRYSSEDPTTVLARIEKDGFRMLGLDDRARFRRLDIDISTSMLQVTADQLKPPSLKWNPTSGGQQPHKASWMMKDCRF
ncbi:uncharacterized protein PV09_09226 [Verruconis gallopava]|uniref:Argonaute linker 1 domain-containing protein n=1 Tax=Verruconis gallopava TaxID=253628 RepID=A0A0D1ZYA5_9PEZI|nr:uncharacterized protein PV09_09226 [Verruconis gallopava]KIV99054.1 hypothetical protein PV09_09226 [Verruconis gallopava]